MLYVGTPTFYYERIVFDFSEGFETDSVSAFQPKMILEK